MSYIEIKIGGELRGLKFNQLAYINFYKKVDQEDYVGTFHYAAVWGALKATAYVKGLEFTENWETVCEWVDAISVEDKEKITHEFSSTATFKNLVKDGSEEKEPPKKKTLKNTMMTV